MARPVVCVHPGGFAVNESDRPGEAGEPNPWAVPSDPYSQPIEQQPDPGSYGQPTPGVYGQPPAARYGQPAAGPYPPPGYGYPAYNPATQESGLAIGSLICSILGIVMCGPLTAVPGVILGHMALGKIKRGEAGGKGMAQAGLIIGYIIIGLTVLAILFFVVLFAGAGFDFSRLE